MLFQTGLFLGENIQLTQGRATILGRGSSSSFQLLIMKADMMRSHVHFPSPDNLPYQFLLMAESPLITDARTQISS